MSTDGVLDETALQEAQRLINAAASEVQVGSSSFNDGTITSYSGADIKAVIHIYDGGKLANQKRQDLSKYIKDLESQMATARGLQNQLEIKVAGGQRMTSKEISDLVNNSRFAVRAENTIAALTDEMSRLDKLKPKFSTKVLAELQTISIQSHREKWPVRSLGTGYVRGVTRGARTIAGSMIFTVFDRDVLEEFLEVHPSDFDAWNPTSTAILDQIPPFDITIAFANELGQVSRMVIYGVEFMNQGQTMSIEDILLENVCQYIARDYDPMRAVARRKIDESNRLTNQMIPTTGTDLLGNPAYQDMKDAISPFERFKRRINPFV